MKYSQWIGIAAAITLIVACFLPWTWHPDVQKTFNGFFSEQNVYGKPGKMLISFSSIAIVFFLIPKIWAKRWNLLVTALLLAFAIRCFIIYSGCYNGICPTKLAGIWLMLACAVLTLAMSLFPDMKVPAGKTKN
ncbi:MAG: hypothetical protein P0Y53_13960 [Candidatus Pseudobacter hemicellulosilyticus]|uniref:Uncharacterized protein n=1 Tax=Candidatus Pseudobacter hemicellulosilyticus TaxID=3121375 RepID=A0AAJ6BEV8_9BACT|nr:MAG: hypothetical protein P0Y53_13960 [Pseudobacter sp.]